MTTQHQQAAGGVQLGPYFTWRSMHDVALSGKQTTYELDRAELRARSLKSPSAVTLLPYDRTTRYMLRQFFLSVYMFVCHTRQNG